MYYTQEMILNAIKELKRGGRFCNSCGCVFHSSSSAWVQPNCPKCGSKENFEYCVQCGGDLEDSRVDYAVRRGGRCLNCYACSRQMKRGCDFCHVRHPDHWKCQQPASLG